MYKDLSPVNNAKGFTLVEIIVVLSITALVFYTAITFANGLSIRSNNAKRESDLREIQSALQQYYADQGFYPCSDSTCMGGSSNFLDLSNNLPFDNTIGNPQTKTVSKTYLNNIPSDPLPSQHYCYLAYKNTNLDPCDNTTGSPNDPINNCHYYRLGAVEENSSNPPLGFSTSDSICQNANIEVNPLVNH